LGSPNLDLNLAYFLRLVSASVQAFNMAMKAKTIIIILGVLAIIGFIALPTFVPARRASPRIACINNLRFMDGAKQQWAIEHHKTNGPITLDDVLLYYRPEWRSYMLHCPAGGTYTVGPVGQDPTCSVKGHELPSP
jgi:general secretion pathway protein G